MRHLAPSIFLLLAAAPSQAQTLQQPTAPAAPYTLKANAQRVLVDVVVRDKKGNPIHGLRQSDFVIAENGQVQSIRNFDEHSALNSAEAVAAPSVPALPPGQFTNFLPVKPSSALTVLLFDRLNTAVRDQAYVRQQLIDYLKHARPDSRIAIYGLTDKLILLQGFSSDPGALLRALDDKSVKASPLRDDVNGGGNGVEDLSAAVNVTNRIDTSLSTAVTAFQAQYQSFQSQIQGKYTLDALNQISRTLGSVPGRKNLIWFAGDFPQGFYPGDNDVSVPYAEFAGLEEEFQQTIDLMTSAQIAVYPVDSQGLRTNAVDNAGISNPQYGRIHGQQSRQGVGAAVDIAKEETNTAREHIGMDQLARDTGGTAFYNNNDLAKAVDDAISAGSNYYTLAYSPSNTGSKPFFRRINVKLNGADYKLSYRRGYYTDVRNARNEPRIQIGGAAPPPLSSLRAALMQGGPEPTEILLRVKAEPVSAVTEPTVLPGNSPNPDIKKSKGPYQAFQVDYATSIRAVLMRKTSDNLFHADLDFVVYCYDGDGILVNAQSNTFRATFTARELTDTMRSGLPFRQRISVPVTGTHYLRLAVHDNIGDKVGAVEIPVSALKALPPFSASQTAPRTPVAPAPASSAPAAPRPPLQ